MLYLHDREQRNLCKNWRSWDRLVFADVLDVSYPDLSTTSAGARTFCEKMAQVLLTISLQDSSVNKSLDEKLDTICTQHPDRTSSDELAALALLIKKLPQEGPVNWRARFLHTAHSFPGGVMTVDDFRLALRSMLDTLREMALTMESFGVQQLYTASTAVNCSIPPPNNSSLPTVPSGSRKRPKAVPGDLGCIGCGRQNHTREQCHFKSSTFFNTSSSPFLTSVNGIKLLAAFPDKDCIPGKRTHLAAASTKFSSLPS
jgi:hypothetical protein